MRKFKATKWIKTNDDTIAVCALEPTENPLAVASEILHSTVNIDGKDYVVQGIEYSGSSTPGLGILIQGDKKEDV